MHGGNDQAKHSTVITPKMTYANFFPVDIKSQCEDQCHWNDHLCNHFRHIGEVVRVLQRMCGVGAEIAATIRSQVLDGNEGRSRTA